MFITKTTLKKLPRIVLDPDCRRRYLDLRALSPEGWPSLRGLTRYLLTRGVGLIEASRLFPGWSSATPEGFCTRTIETGHDSCDLSSGEILALANHDGCLWRLGRSEANPCTFFVQSCNFSDAGAKLLPLDAPRGGQPTGLVSFRDRLWVVWTLPDDIEHSDPGALSNVSAMDQTEFGARLQLRAVNGAEILEGLRLGPTERSRCALPFADASHTGWVMLGRVMPVYKYAAYLKESIEWRRWHSGLWLDHQHAGTALVAFGDGWLTIVREPLAQPRGGWLHRFIAFGPNLDTVAATEPFTLSRSTECHCSGLATSEDGRHFVLAFSTSGEARSEMAFVPVSSVADRLTPCLQSQLQFPTDFRKLRFLHKEPVS